jgi:hypothetical protein
MTATFLISITNKMTPVPPPSSTIVPASNSNQKSYDVRSLRSTDDSHQNDIILSIKSPALIKKKGGLGEGLSPTSLQSLCSSMASTNPKSSAMYHRLIRRESEPITHVPLKGNMSSFCSNTSTATTGVTNDTNSFLTNHVPTTGVNIGSSTTGSSSNNVHRRRQIFASFWDAETSTSQLQSSPTSPLARNRTKSSSCVDTSVPTVPLPPAPRCIRSKSEGHEYANISKSHFYPMPWKQSPISTLPSPMQRLRKTSGGVYPLVQPQSILRRRSTRTDAIVQTDDTCELNLTQTMRGNINGIKRSNSISDDASTLTDCDRASNSSISSISSSTNVGENDRPSSAMILSTKKKVVKFDPRITVTELAEQDHQRVWYSDAELSRFKYETVATARAYLLDHPTQVAIYSQATFDPITKTMRKRALFSMPALADVSISDLDEDEYRHNSRINAVNSDECFSSKDGTERSTVLLNPQHLVSLLAFEGDSTIHPNINNGKNINAVDATVIRHILIVDHNPWILDLFARSVRTMFDCAIDNQKQRRQANIDIQCASTVQVALSHIQQTSQHRQPPFDLIIAEQQPFVQQQEQEEKSTLENNSSINEDSVHGGSDCKSSSLEETSKAIVKSNCMSGADCLFQNIIDRDQILLVCVSSNRSSCGSNTADLVWGKPPPRMDSVLRTQLIRALQRKRQRCQQNQIEQE